MNKPLLAFSLLILACTGCNNDNTGTKNTIDSTKKDGTSIASVQQDTMPVSTTLDTARYDALLQNLANGDSSGKWPVKAPYPLPGAILPFNRIIAYYGNLYSKKMGVLGEYPKDSMLAMLKAECARWQKADSTIPIIPALHYIAVTAQGAPGRDGKYRARMPHHQIDTMINWAKPIKALVFVDVQVGHSTVQAEIPLLENYLKQPGVHLGIDPEFSMKGGEVPGRKIGTYDAADINYVIDYLAKLVRENHLPPKILVVHRFTQRMITNYQQIKKTPEVQVVIDMDGWGDKTLKLSTHLAYIKREPVQFSGFKLFYHNDTKHDPNGMYTPEELLKLTPKPIYIQYQ